MRTISGTITTAEVGSALAYRHAATIQNELLSFGTQTALSNGSLDINVTQSFRMQLSSNSAYATYRHTNGNHYLRAVDIGTSSDFQLSSTSATTLSNSIAMRAGVSFESGNYYLYDAYSSGGSIKVRRAALSGVSNPITVSFSDYSTLPSAAYTDTSTLVRRVEAVCPTDTGAVVVCIGEHDFTNDRTTLTFWWIESASSQPFQLNTMFQFPMTETYTNWYSCARHCSNVAAVSITNGVVVIAPSIPAATSYGQFGRTVSFIVRLGVDSVAEACVPTDVEQASVYWCGSSLTTINGIIYQGGTMTRYSSDGTTTSYEGYLSSTDGKYWSVGERNHYIGTAAMRGTMLMAASGSTVYYVGGLYHASAPATAIQNPSVSGQSVTVTSDIRGFSINQITNGADTIDMQIDNADGAYDASALLKRGAALYLDSGQESTLSDFATYGIDTVTKGINVNGRTALKLRGRDIAGKRIADYKFPVDLWLDSHGYLTTDLQSTNGLVIKTRDAGYKFTTGDRLKHDGLNTPFIAYADANHGDVAMQRATVYMGVSDNYHVSSVGFLINASGDGAGHVALMPKASSWTTYGKTQPEVRRLNLPAVNTTDAGAEDSGFQLKERTNTIFANAGNGTQRTAAIVGGSYRTRATASLAANTTYDVVTRTDGRRVQLFTKVNNYAPASASANAGYTLQMEWLADYSDALKRPIKTSGGIVLATDVMGDTTLWGQAGSDDITTSLTSADSTTAFTTNFTGGFKDSPANRVSNMTSISGLSVDQYVRLYAASYVDGIFRITTVNSSFGNHIVVSPDMPSMPLSTPITIYTTAAQTYSGYGSSGISRKGPFFGLYVLDDPGAVKRTRKVRGRGFFVTNDATAGSLRFVESDGVYHYLMNISPTTKVGWDLTNPVPDTVLITGNTGGITTYSSSSDPSTWRLLMSNSYLTSSSLATLYNLPSGSSPAYLKVGDEVVRYSVESFTQYGGASTSWTIIPAYYAPLAAMSAGSSTLRNWRSSGGNQPGDNLGDAGSGGGITNPAGLYVEVSSRNIDSGNEADRKLYYVTSATYVGSPSVGSTSYITLDTPYENVVNGVNATTLEGFGDVAIVSGRAQFGRTIETSRKASHDADAPVVYYPCNTSTGEQAYIKATRYDSFSGPYQTTEDAIKRICALAGQRSVTFRNAFTSAYSTGTYGFTVGTSATTLPTFENLSNFALDLDCHIPSASTTGTGYGNVTSVNQLVVDFRSYYRLVIGTYNKAEDINLGRLGTLRVGLLTTSTDITADGSGNRWLEWATVSIGDANLSGSYTGSNPNFTASETASRNSAVRIVAQDNLVYVEVNGKHVWTFNLTAYTDGTNSYDKRTTGPITVAYTSAVGGNSATARVLELGDPVPAVSIQSNSSARAGIDQVTQDRHIRSRAGQTGGIEFSQFINRDDGGTLRYNLLKHDWSTEDTRNAGHVQVTGQNVAGEALDDTQLRTEGYMFDTADNRLITVATQARLEARLWQRDMKEGYQVDGLTGYARIALQPEDKISLQYAPSTEGITTLAATDKVIDSVTLTADEKSMKANYSVRRYVSTI